MIVIIDEKAFDTDTAELLYRSDQDCVEFLKSQHGNIIKHVWSSGSIAKVDRWYLSGTGDMIEMLKEGKLNNPTMMYQALKELGIAGEIGQL